MEKLYKALDDVITCIIESDEYMMCNSLKDKMKENSEITFLIEEVKRLQKEYVKKGFDSEVKIELDNVTKRLNEIPIYNVYLCNLEKVNEKIDFVRDSLNDYFYKLLNEKESS